MCCGESLQIMCMSSKKECAFLIAIQYLFDGASRA